MSGSASVGPVGTLNSCPLPATAEAADEVSSSGKGDIEAQPVRKRLTAKEALEAATSQASTTQVTHREYRV